MNNSTNNMFVSALLQSLVATSWVRTAEEAACLRGVVECDAPNNTLDKFSARLILLLKVRCVCACVCAYVSVCCKREVGGVAVWVCQL